MKLVEIEWVDSSNAAGGTWHHKDDIDHGKNLSCRSVGWMLHDQKEYIVIVAHQSFGNADGSLRQVGGDMTIPRCAITKIRVIRKAGK